MLIIYFVKNIKREKNKSKLKWCELMELKGRLKLIADKVPKCRLLCDVGTDHAYIPIYLVERGICEKAIASDVRKGPIDIADENIRKAGLENVVECRLGYGLDTLEEHESDVIVIAGMGGALIAEILNKGFIKAKKATCLVLQPMKAPEVLRQWLYLNGFDITDEELIGEENKIYNVIVARWTGVIREQEPIFLLIGEKLVEKRDLLLSRLLSRNIRILDKIIQGQKKSERKNFDIQNTIEMRDALKRLLDMQKEN